MHQLQDHTVRIVNVSATACARVGRIRTRVRRSTIVNRIDLRWVGLTGTGTAAPARAVAIPRFAYVRGHGVSAAVPRLTAGGAKCAVPPRRAPRCGLRSPRGPVRSRVAVPSRERSSASARPHVASLRLGVYTARLRRRSPDTRPINLRLRFVDVPAFKTRCQGCVIP